VSALWDDNGDGQSGTGERIVLVTQAGLNHEVNYYNGYLYASAATTVYRWTYTPGQRTAITTPAQIVVSAIPGGGHDSRTLAFKDDIIYVHVGALGNVDSTSDRSRIVRFSLNTIPNGGHAFNGTDDTVQLFADGVRNENGVGFDRFGLLWGVQNGRDNLVRADMGGSIVTDNPCEEINSYNETNAGRFYGYPYCWSDTGMDQRTGGSSRDQWADTEFFDTPYTDAWCRNTDNNIPPRWCLGAHQAPLGFAFYESERYSGPYVLPAEYDGDMFVALHGSWNRSPAAGYQLRRIDFDVGGGSPVDDEFIFEFNGANPPNGGAGWVRPVAASVLPGGIILVTADTTSEIFAVRFIGNALA